MHTFHLRGLVAAPFTPFHDDGSLWIEQIQPLADKLAADRVEGAFICGTTGEGMSLTDEERTRVADAWVRAARRRFKVIVHAGHLSGAASAILAAHAQEIGADAVASCGPFFFPIRAVTQVVTALKPVAAMCARLPFYFYHIPQLTHLGQLGMIDLLKEAALEIPNLHGIKYTHNDLEEYTRLLEQEGARLDFPFGRDEIFLSALAVGARGAIGSSFNFIPSVFHDLMAAFERRDLDTARKLQARAAETVRMMRAHGGLAAMKATMKLLGYDCGPVRAPLRNLTPAEETSLAHSLRALEIPITA